MSHDERILNEGFRETLRNRPNSRVQSFAALEDARLARLLESRRTTLPRRFAIGSVTSTS